MDRYATPHYADLLYLSRQSRVHKLVMPQLKKKHDLMTKMRRLAHHSGARGASLSPALSKGHFPRHKGDSQVHGTPTSERAQFVGVAAAVL